MLDKTVKRNVNITTKHYNLDSEAVHNKVTASALKTKRKTVQKKIYRKKGHLTGPWPQGVDGHSLVPEFLGHPKDTHGHAVLGHCVGHVVPDNIKQ